MNCLVIVERCKNKKQITFQERTAQLEQKLKSNVNSEQHMLLLQFHVLTNKSCGGVSNTCSAFVCPSANEQYCIYNCCTDVTCRVECATAINYLSIGSPKTLKWKVCDHLVEMTNSKSRCVVICFQSVVLEVFFIDWNKVLPCVSHKRKLIREMKVRKCSVNTYFILMICAHIEHW